MTGSQLRIKPELNCGEEAAKEVFYNFDTAIKTAYTLAVGRRTKVDVILEVFKRNKKTSSFIVATIRGNKFQPNGTPIYSTSE